MATVDVTVRGAGIFGLSVAWACVQRGARVQVIDPGGVGAGASGGIVGALAPHTPERWNEKKAFQFDSLMMAQGFWDSVAAASGMSSGYGRTGRIQPVMDARGLELARARGDEAARLWQGRATWEVVQNVGDWAPVSPTGYWIRDTLSARVHPRQGCLALAAALTGQGCAIRREGIDQGAVVWATGVAGLRDLGAGAGNGVKGQAALLSFDARTAPQLFADTVHIVPHSDGTVAIGSTSEREFEDGQATDGLLEGVLERAIAACPVLRGAPVVQRWAGVRPRSRSRAPVLGAWPGRAGHFVANGGFKIGFGMAPKVAQVMADLVLDGRDAIPDPFRVAVNLV
ncbi:NAD(P)/FAD-dependent oxidoreductase [Oceaniglobus ichthyenteri]|uniref:NAD(P)/FAD-dependent oxidoreductase n=1 Tax=Oceaniglobus ichthyenteri TaxID=2136177 RepID=UPI000D387A15|nr:FAD-dependent oxidoreductase [Oceaniglobus ichthyenteri]